MDRDLESNLALATETQKHGEFRWEPSRFEVIHLNGEFSLFGGTALAVPASNAVVVAVPHKRRISIQGWTLLEALRYPRSFLCFCVSVASARIRSLSESISRPAHPEDSRPLALRTEIRRSSCLDDSSDWSGAGETRLAFTVVHGEPMAICCVGVSARWAIPRAEHFANCIDESGEARPRYRSSNSARTDSRPP
jgi:hypothetical protein